MTRHCHQCGWPYPLTGQPGRGESCHQCGADLKVCLNCVHYDARVAHQCRDQRADPVAEKHVANFCEWFEFVRREWQSQNQPNAREEAARDQLKKLFGD
jgi:ribosome-binding protein aMBF1 (putative translation factor)